MESERWSRSLLAKTLNKDYNTVKRWVSGESQPPVGYAIRITRLLKGESVEALWGHMAPKDIN
jgi:ribosome-binding protein aMBF1 (putative translation factor)